MILAILAFIMGLTIGIVLNQWAVAAYIGGVVVGAVLTIIIYKYVWLENG